jgi:hypothetical protein
LGALLPVTAHLLLPPGKPAKRQAAYGIKGHARAYSGVTKQDITAH